jgi:hypothetical protein
MSGRIERASDARQGAALSAAERAGAPAAGVAAPLGRYRLAHDDQGACAELDPGGAPQGDGAADALHQELAIVGGEGGLEQAGRSAGRRRGAHR